MKDLDYGKGYQYAHDYNLNFVNQEFLPEELSNTRIFEPGQNSKENAIRSFLKERWEDKYGY
jgi:putative ATPase